MSKGPGLESFAGQLVAAIEQIDAQTTAETPFRIALIGDWSGRSNRSLFASSPELATWRPLVIDRDNLDQTISRLGVKLHLPVTSDGSLSLTIDFNQLDDFHPDRIFQRLEMFETLRRTRFRLSNSKTFGEAAEEVRKWASSSPTESLSGEPRAMQEPFAGEASASKGSLLDQILEAKTNEVTKPASASSNLSPDISALVREVVKPYLVPGDEEERGELIATVDTAISKELRAIMHQPDFQALEAAWRALDFLASRLETGPTLKLHLLDISREEFEADLLGENEIDSSGLYKLLVERTVGTPGATPWAVVAANYEFDFSSKDAKLLERASLIASAAGAPFIAAAKSAVAGCESLFETPDPDEWRQSLDAETETAWDTLKQLPSARYLGLALPRFLMRLPYGAETRPTEEFDFEELPMDTPPEHESYLWANPTFAIAYLLATAFSESGWNLRPGDFQEIEGLPLHIYRQDGDSLKPCAEVLLTVRAAKKIIDRGLMPLISMKDTDVLRLGLFQSLAGTRLAGRWGKS